MLAARADQENAVHAHQTAAAAKPLNQGIRGLAAKTPGNRVPKTPFKVQLNDENTAFQAGKTNGKGQEKGLTLKKGGQLDKSAFVTPAGPRNRAPLGFKTTNAKATVFQTPASKSLEQSPEKSQLKTVSPRLRRAKVKVHQEESVENGEVEEREIEYMPPKAMPLPDYPSDDEFGPDKTFPQFEPENMTRGWPSIYFVDDNGVSLADKREAEQKAFADKYTDELIKKAMEDDSAAVERSVMDDLAFLPSPTKPLTEEDHRLQKKPQAPMRKPTPKISAPPTLAAKSAASALYRPSKVSPIPSYAAPTKAKASSSSILGRKTRPAAPLSSSTVKHATASAASHSTLGYAKGRAASQGLRKPLGSVFNDGSSQQRSASAAAPARKDPIKELEELMLLREETAEEDDDLFGGGGVSLDLDDELEDFQLKMPTLEE